MSSQHNYNINKADRAYQEQRAQRERDAKAATEGNDQRRDVTGIFKLTNLLKPNQPQEVAENPTASVKPKSLPSTI